MPIVPFPITAENFEGFKAQVLELIRVLYEENWGGVPLPSNMSAEEVGQQAQTIIGGSGADHVVLFPWNYHIITQGTWATGFSAAYVYQTVLYNTSNAQNDGFLWYCSLAAGTYSMVLYFSRGTYGTAHVYIDDKEVVTFNLAGSADPDARLTADDIVVTEGGLKTIAIKAASSTSGYYYLFISSLCLYRTA